MVTLIQFLWIVHAILVLGYLYEIGLYIYRRKKYPQVFNYIKENIPDFGDAIPKQEVFSGAVTIVVGHAFSYCLAIKGISLPFIALAIAAIYFITVNEMLKPYVRAFKANTRPDTEDTRSQERYQSSYHGADSDFDFDPNRFTGGPRANTGSSYNAEADYEGALREAQAWADSAATEKGAHAYASKFEKLSKNPGLHPKDRLRYQLAAMLLRERLKGTGTKPPPTPEAEPADADLRRHGFPVPVKTS